MSQFPEPLARLIRQLGKLPGVGRKTAQRLALTVVTWPPSDVEALASAITVARAKIAPCSICGGLTEIDPCRICADGGRDQEIICVVEDVRDILALERTHEFKGLYHVLNGSISPVEGIGPEELRVKELLERLRNGRVREMILATNPDVEGETTALYLAQVVKPLGIRVSRLAHGLPVGADLEYADEVTLSRALEGRRDL
ncbi:MAG: recombination protein RecR [Firmicutes bacterium]|nr:recombination protein RecR [Bacillota bacterium]